LEVLLPVGFALLASIGGCIGAEENGLDPTNNDPGNDNSPTVDEPSVLAATNATEPEGLQAPGFEVLDTLARNGPVYGGGEPSIWTHTDGTTYVAFPGCEDENLLVDSYAPDGRDCRNGLVYRSSNLSSWTNLNGENNGLGGEGPAANGDADITTDANGTVYASNLGGGGVQVWRSTTQGENWSYVGQLDEEGDSADRQWMVAGEPGHLTLIWDDSDGLVARTSTDGGRTFQDEVVITDETVTAGQLHVSPSGERLVVPFIQLESAGPPGTTSGGTWSVRVAQSTDEGGNWSIHDTGARFDTSQTGLHISGSILFASADVTGDGTIVVAWARERPGPSGQNALGDGAVVEYTLSRDGGDTWTDTHPVNTRTSAIFPWVTAGAGDRFSVVYYASDTGLDTDRVGGIWDVEAAFVDPSGPEPTIERSIVDERVHEGGICSQGANCLATGGDRALLDFFESDLLPSGELVVTYGADPVADGKYIDVRVAVQDSGTPLAVPQTNATG